MVPQDARRRASPRTFELLDHRHACLERERRQPPQQAAVWLGPRLAQLLGHAPQYAPRAGTARLRLQPRRARAEQLPPAVGAFRVPR
jgi:hypothetical protein